jgi:hypothetical protein
MTTPAEYKSRLGLMERVTRKRALIDATVIAFDCRGCMATDHQFMWVGVVVGFEMTRFAGEAAKVRIIKKGNGPGDARDGTLGFELEPIENGALQQLAPKLWAVYR